LIYNQGKKPAQSSDSKTVSQSLDSDEKRESTLDLFD